MLNILSFTTLYPNETQPVNGIFVENRLRHLVASKEVRLQVVAPVPWFPFRSPAFGHYADFARVPETETRYGIEIIHPRYLLIPKVGMTITPFLMYLAMKPVIRRVIATGFEFDLIDAHYFYPDGVAAALLARDFQKPLTITARGTDINLIPKFRLPRKQILWAADQAAGMITVCQALKDSLVEIGADEKKIFALRNGVDLDMFRPSDRDEARKKYQLTKNTLLSVGHLIERKGHYIAITALKELPAFELLIAGDGPDRQELETLAKSLNVSERVKFLGRVPHDELSELYTAADALILASSREGWANVLLESMACGTPVIASNVWGTPEIVRTKAAGVLMDERNPDALVRAAKLLFSDLPSRTETRAYAEQFSWDDTTNGQLTLFNNITANVTGTLPRGSV